MIRRTLHLTTLLGATLFTACGAEPSSTSLNAAASEAGAVTSACHKAPDAWTCRAEGAIAKLANEERRKAGVDGRLQLDQKISFVSRLWSAEQARRQDLSHEWFQTRVLHQKYREEFQEPARIMAENVAMTSACGADPEATAETFIAMWMRSPGHRANILRTGLTTIGVGMAKTSDGCYATQDFGN